MGPTESTSAVRLNTTTVLQYIATLKHLAAGKRKVFLLRAAPVWDDAPELGWGERRARVAAGPSPLAVYELVLGHLAPGADGPDLMMVLTDCEESELGADLLAQVHKHRVNTVDIWDVVREAFGAQGTDPRLSTENWAAEALLDASPPGGWPQLAGGPLTRRHALASLALRRLGAGPYDPDQKDRAIDPVIEFDINTLLRWSLSAGAPERFQALRPPERAGLSRFLGEEDQAGHAGRALLALVEAGHGADAVAFGLVCAALWVHSNDSIDAQDYRARGRAERWFGEELAAHGDTLDALAEALGRASEEFVSALLLTGRSVDQEAELARRQSTIVLDRAASLTRQFGAERAAGTSPMLPTGLETRFAAVGRALEHRDPGNATEAIRTLEQHRLASTPDVGIRVERAKMALRLARWLSTEPRTTSETVAAGIDRHLAETCWVDLALEHIEAGGDPAPELKAAYDALCEAVRTRRREIDRQFVDVLATWTAAGSGSGTMLTVESFLAEVVAPVVKTADRRILLIVLDGMSASIATELAEELRQSWAEYDPLPTTKDAPHRRGMLAGLPTVTPVSRTSLFAGRLMIGSQAEEQAAFRRHAFWGGQNVALFHKDGFRAESGGDAFSPELHEAIAGSTHVAVVLNTIDDRLAKEQKLGDGKWSLGEIGGLRELLRLAAEQGRAVIMTSDHGHVVDRRGIRADAPTSPLSARHRAPGGSLGPAEIALTGPRVMSPDTGNAIVALWDTDSRYTALKAGYHGGASLAEVAIPVLALLPFGAAPPNGWRELGDQQPSWWSSRDAVLESTVQPSVPQPVTPKRTTKKRRDDTDLPSLFEMELVPDESSALLSLRPVSPADALVNDLLASDMFQAQIQALVRKPNLKEVENALRALLDAGGVLPVTALAQRINLPATRSPDGFAAVLRQLVNFDGVQVLETLPDGRTLRLNATLLRDQFELRRVV